MMEGPAASCTACSPQEKCLPVHIVEDHDEALPLIYRAIGSKQLPFRGITLIHFDAHPDLLSPDMKADNLLNTELLYSQTSIADWILPAIYIGHIACMVWLKPPWASQIPEGKHQLLVGKDPSSGHIRLGTPLSYFISELLYLPASELESTRTIPFFVFTVHPQSETPDRTPSAEDDCKIPPASKRCKREHSSCDTRDCVGDTDMYDTTDPVATDVRSNVFDVMLKELMGIIKESAVWILDIDLDFFSTGNPFKSLYTQDQYDLLCRLYQLSESHDPTVCLQRRREQLELLKRLWSTDVPDPTISSALGLSSCDEGLVDEMRSLIGTIHDDDTFVDADYLHMSGMLTDLPVHMSSQDEIERLVITVFKLLRKVKLKRPSLVTIARSTEDEYTPPNQVELIQDLVTMATKQSYNNNGSTVVQFKYHYLTRGGKLSSNWVYESPADICDCTYL